MDNLLRGMLVPHTPRFFDPDRAGPVFRPVIRGLEALGEEVVRLAPDALVIASAHWVTTFHHYVAGPRRLAGVLTSTEAPDLVRHVPYDYPGDPELARALVEAGTAHQVPAVLTEEPFLPLDDGTGIPLRYLTPAGTVPIVPISLCYLADLAETLRWGRAIGAAVRAGRKRTILAVSGDAGELAEFETSLGELPREAQVEAGGRQMALLLGALGSGYRGRILGYGPSSGTGNAVVTLSPT